MSNEKEPKAGASQVFPPPPPCPNGFIYTVQSGDTLFLIARRFGVSLQALINANPQIPNPNLIFPGQQICVPTGVAPFQCPPGTFTYIVQPGDTMFFIAQRFGVSLQALIAANPQIPDPNRIFPGQTVCVPQVPPFQCPPGTFTYIVQPGDTMFLIAQRFGVSLAALIAANPQIPDPNRIFPGQTVCVPQVPPPPPPPPPCPGGFLHTVIPGETIFFIAERFGITVEELLAANPQVTDPCRLTPGQQLCIPMGVRPNLCPVILVPISNPDAMGAAFLQLAPGFVSIAAVGLPLPSTVDPNFSAYVGWVIDVQTGVLARVPMLQTTILNTWVGAGPDTTLAGADEVTITMEQEPVPDRPTGPRVLQGSARHCTLLL